MIIAVLQGDDYRVAIEDLNSKGFYATVLHSTGGFLKKKSVTLMVGVHHDHLEEAMAILKRYGDRIEMQYQSAAAFSSGGISSAALSSIPSIEIPVHCGGVVLFVMDVQQNERY